MKKPDAMKNKHLKYLDDLRESGVCNMWGASSYLSHSYPELSDRESRDILGYWMETFGERHGQ